MTNRLFISKNSSETKALESFLKEKNIALISHSFLEYEALEFSIEKKYTVLFFGSPRAVWYFTNSITIPANVRIGCIGESTARELKNQGYSCDFVGDGSNANQIAVEFKDWCQPNDIVLFPISTQSLNSVSSLFEPSEKLVIQVYDTVILGTKIEPCDTYVFTSPSNLTGFLAANELNSSADVIAWGSSTSEAVKTQNIQISHVLEKPSIENLIGYLRILP